MSVYTWATNMGARDVPSAGVKASGFIPNTPAPAKILNDVLGELSAASIATDSKFAIQHDPADGKHTDITGQTIELVIPGDQWMALGVDGFVVQDEADFVDLLAYPWRVNQAGIAYSNTSSTEDAYAINNYYGDPSTPLYKSVTRHYFVTQATAQGTGAVGDISAGSGVVRQFEVSDPGANTALMAFDRPVGSYIKTIGIYYIPVGDDYTLSFRVYGLSAATLSWAWDGDIEGTLTGGVGEGGVAQYKEVSFAGNGVLTGSDDIRAGLQFNCTDGGVVIRCVKIIYRTTSIETML